ncbi:MAG: glycosyltransferase family 2 protein [Ignavibacteriales bacterium]
MSDDPKVATVIVNWNKKDYVLNLLNSLKTLDYQNHEIIVIDNASTDGSVEAIKQQFPRIQVIVNSENLGGSGGFNTGIKHALKKGGYKYIWLLDNDVEVEKDTLTELVETLEINKNVGIVGSAMYDLSNREGLIEIGNFMNLSRGIMWGNKRFALKEDIEKDFYFVDSVSGCSLCASTEAIANVGIWDENFFIYCDDVDWNIRFREKGYKIAAVSKSRIWHLPWEFKVGFNTVYYANRNMLYLMNKHLASLNKIFGLIYKELSIIWLSLFLLKSGQNLYSIIALKSIIDFVDMKTGKFKEEDFLERLKINASKGPYKEWLKTFMELVYKNAQKILILVKLTFKINTVETARFFFKKFPEKSRIRIIKMINDFLLSKRIKCMKT